MRLNLDKPEETVFTRNRKGVRFLPLGLEKADDLSRAAKNKIRHARRGSVDAVWGTIGMADNSPPIWKGAIHFSRAGSRSSTPRRSGNATMEEIGHVYEGRSEAVNADRDKAKVLERFISFEDLTFADLPDTFSLEEIPKLRLTLMLDGDEGALVFIQHVPKDKPEKARGKEKLLEFPEYRDWGRYVKPMLERPDDGSAVEYVQPQPTPGHGGTSLTARASSRRRPSSDRRDRGISRRIPRRTGTTGSCRCRSGLGDP